MAGISSFPPLRPSSGVSGMPREPQPRMITRPVDGLVYEPLPSLFVRHRFLSSAHPHPALPISVIV